VNPAHANQPAYLACSALNISSPLQALRGHHAENFKAQNITMPDVNNRTNNKQIVSLEKITTLFKSLWGKCWQLICKGE